VTRASGKAARILIPEGWMEGRTHDGAVVLWRWGAKGMVMVEPRNMAAHQAMLARQDHERRNKWAARHGAE
jgi:hypothetical protein